MLLKLSRFFLYAALFSVVIVLPTTSVPFGGMYYFLRLTVELALACLVLWWGFEAQPGALRERLTRIAAEPLVRAVSLFVLAFLAACLFAYDPRAAFWSSYFRGDGGFQMLHNYAFFLLIMLLFDTASHWRRALTLSVVAAFLSIIYGILAAGLVPYFLGYVGTDGQPFDPTFFSRLFSGPRFFGSLGNAAWFATTLLFAIAFSLYLALTSRWKPVWARRLGYGSVILLLLVFFFLSQTRGALLGLMAGVASFLAYLALSNPRHRKRVAAGILIVAALAVVAFAGREFLGAHAVPGQRLLRVDFSDATVHTRLSAWNAAWRGFKERPLLGWGPENFDTVFDRHYDPQDYVPGTDSAAESWVDRAHSILFDTLAETGLVGLVAYAGVFAVFYLQFFSGLRRRHKSADVTRAVVSSAHALFFAVPVAYLVQGLFSFEVLTNYLNLFLFLALSVHWVKCED